MNFKLLLLLPILICCKQASQNVSDSKIINLDFGFKAVAQKEEDFGKFKTYSYFELIRNDKVLFADSSAEYEFGDKMYPLVLRTDDNSFELLFEINDRPSKNYLNRIFIKDGKMVGQDKLPTFIGKPVDINKDGTNEYAGFMFYGQAFGRDYDLTGYNPILYYSFTKTGLHLDSALTKQRNELIYGHFYGFEYSAQFEQPTSTMKKFEEEIKLIEASSN